MTEAMRSMDEWMASEIMLTEPIENPMMNFMMTSPALEITERRAVFSFS
jgi:hypothetical protein